jgi:hypothetical protein
MDLALESGVTDSLAAGFEAWLANGLAGECFSTHCWVLKMQGYPKVLLECPDTPRRILVDTRRQSAWHMQWIRDELEAAVIAGKLRIERGLPSRSQASCVSYRS